MFIRILSLVYLFLVRLRFPSCSSVAEIVRKRYGDEVLRKIRKFEKLDFRTGKLQMDITFLETCVENDVMPNFVKFRTASRTLKKSESYHACQRILLTQEICDKKVQLIESNQGISTLKRELRNELSGIDFLFISSLFLNKNREVLKQIEQKQNEKLVKLLDDSPKHNADDLIYNFSSHTLTSSQKTILMKGLNFSLPPKSLKNEDYLLNFELLFRSLNSDKFHYKDNEFDNFKSELRNMGYSTLRFYNQKKKKLENISEDEWNALKELTSLDNIIIQKADKGNVIVLADKISYTTKMEGILSDMSKFTPITFEGQYDDLRYLLDKEKEIKEFLTSLKNKGVISAEELDRMVPTGSSPGILYGLCKVHKGIQGDCPPFRPILSAIGTPSYKLAKYLVPILAPITTNRFVCKDSFSFATEVRAQNPDLFMSSFDVDSLFTNIPLDETIEICVKKLFGKNKRKFKGFTRAEFRQLLQFAVKDALILFNGKYYLQKDGVAMGSPLGPTLANIFLCHWEEVWLNNCPKQFSPIFYRRYIDDTFVLFSSKDHVKKFHEYLNSRHKNMSFTYEIEENNKLSFLDVLVNREKDCFITSLYRKPTFSGLYTNFDSYISDKYKTGLIFCLLFRLFTLTVDWKKFHEEVEFLKVLFRKNLFPVPFIDKCILAFVNKKIKPVIKHTVEKKKFVISLPFLGRYSNDLRKKICALTSRHLKGCVKVEVIWNSERKIRNFFSFKDKLPMHLRSNVLYRYTCNGCNSVYLGKTKRHFLVRAFEHLGLSVRTEKRFTYNPNNPNNSALLDHFNQTSCQGNLDTFELIGGARNDFHLRIKESLLIKKFKPKLNQSGKSIPLYLFD